MSISYKSFTLNAAGDPAPWGATENQLDKDLIDTMVKDACTQAKDATNGHRHFRLYKSDGSAATITADASGDLAVEGSITQKTYGFFDYTSNNIVIQNLFASGDRYIDFQDNAGNHLLTIKQDGVIGIGAFSAIGSPEATLSADATTMYLTDSDGKWRLLKSGSDYTDFINTSGGDLEIQHLNGDINIVPQALLKLEDAKNIQFGFTTGTKIASSSTQKIAFWGATPVTQRSHIADPAGGATQDAEARTAINSILSALETIGVLATS